MRGAAFAPAHNPDEDGLAVLAQGEQRAAGIALAAVRPAQVEGPRGVGLLLEVFVAPLHEGLELLRRLLHGGAQLDRRHGLHVLAEEGALLRGQRRHFGLLKDARPSLALFTPTELGAPAPAVVEGRSPFALLALFGLARRAPVFI